MNWPPLPKRINGLAGPIRIDRPLVVNPLKPTDIGMWLSDERRILVCSTLTREVAWQTLIHELNHAALGEAGCQPMSYWREENVVEACASGMMHVIRFLLTQANSTNQKSPTHPAESP